MPLNIMSHKKSTIHPLLGFLGAFFFGSVLLIAGIGMTYLGATLLQEGRASLSWHTCEGIITYSEFKRPGRNSGPPRIFIHYEYTVEGKKYTGDRYSVRGTEGRRGDDRRIVDAHPVGRVVTVYYSPSSPETSLLAPGTKYGDYIILGFGIIISFFGAIIVCASVRSVAGK